MSTAYGRPSKSNSTDRSWVASWSLVQIKSYYIVDKCVGVNFCEKIDVYKLTGPPLEPGGPDGPLGPGSPCQHFIQYIFYLTIQHKLAVSTVSTALYLFSTWTSGSQWANRTWGSLFMKDDQVIFFIFVAFYSNYQRQWTLNCCDTPELYTNASSHLFQQTCRE